MAELLECCVLLSNHKTCGFRTVRCGMTNHVKRAHPEEYRNNGNSIEGLVKSLGEVKHWSKNKQQIPRESTWKCFYCGHLNPNKKLNCENCGKKGGL